jgi:C4-dicarboxylate-binding protein DctP
VHQGRVQMIAPALSKLSGVVPELGVFDLPYLYPDLDGYHRVFDGKIGSVLSASVAKHNMVPLAYWDSGLKQFTTNLRPISKPTDLNGSTMRIMPSAILDHQFSLLQVKPVQTDFNDVYTSLAQGRIQGEENTISNIYSKKFYQVQRYMTLSDHGYLGYLVLIDQKFWNQLPEDIRTTLRDTLAEVTSWQRQQSVKIEQDKLKQIESCNCIQINRLSAADKSEWRRYFQPLYSEMQKRLGSELFQQLQLPAW